MSKQRFVYASLPDGGKVKRHTDRPYLFVIAVKDYSPAYIERYKKYYNGNTPKDDGDWGAWGWSMSAKAAEKTAATARKVYSNVIIVPVEGTTNG